MANDIVDKLRFLGTGLVGTMSGHHAPLMNEAADLIETLRTENNAGINLLERWLIDAWLGGSDETVFDDTLTSLGLDESDVESLMEKEPM